MQLQARGRTNVWKDFTPSQLLGEGRDESGWRPVEGLDTFSAPRRIKPKARMIRWPKEDENQRTKESFDLFYSNALQRMNFGDLFSGSPNSMDRVVDPERSQFPSEEAIKQRLKNMKVRPWEPISS